MTIDGYNIVSEKERVIAIKLISSVFNESYSRKIANKLLNISKYLKLNTGKTPNVHRVEIKVEYHPSSFRIKNTE